MDEDEDMSESAAASEEYMGDDFDLTSDNFQEGYELLLSIAISYSLALKYLERRSCGQRRKVNLELNFKLNAVAKK